MMNTQMKDAMKKAVPTGAADGERKTLRAILIDPVERRVTEIQVAVSDKDIDAINEQIGSDCFCAADYGTDGDVIYVDDEGLLKAPEILVERGFFRLGRQGHPIAGRGVWCGVDKEGAARDVQITLEEAKQRVRFVTAEMVGDRVQIYA